MADFEEIIRVNLARTFLDTKHVARVMNPAWQGSIIITSSICGKVGGFASHAYPSSKHVMLGLMRNIAMELGEFGIRVNYVSPYIVASEMSKNFLKLDDAGLDSVYSNLKGEILRAEHIADATLVLASDDSKYVSGHNLMVDEGFTIVSNRFDMYDNPSN